jgi:hypothetical protein
MQNKPNLLNALMNVKSFHTVDYENKSNWKLGENKPNQTQILELTAGCLSRKTQQRFEIVFYPAPVQNNMHNHKTDKQNSQIKVDIAPFVPGHRPEFFYVFSAAAVEEPTASTCAGGQNVLHNKAGNSQTQQGDKADEFDNKI